MLIDFLPLAVFKFVEPPENDEKPILQKSRDKFKIVSLKVTGPMEYVPELVRWTNIYNTYIIILIMLLDDSLNDVVHLLWCQSCMACSHYTEHGSFSNIFLLFNWWILSDIRWGKYLVFSFLFFWKKKGKKKKELSMKGIFFVVSWPINGWCVLF